MDAAVIFDRVSFSYDAVSRETPRRVLDGASFQVGVGEWVALRGPNGAGKTTALKLLLGIEKPQAGRVVILPGPLGYVPQQAQVDRAFPITVREVVRMGRLRGLSRRFGPGDEAAVETALGYAGVADLALRRYGELSGGERRRVLVARALAALEGGLPGERERGLLILDEPTVNLDEESEKRLLETLEGIKAGRYCPRVLVTILIVTHDREFARGLVDRTLHIDGGGRIV